MAPTTEREQENKRYTNIVASSHDIFSDALRKLCPLIRVYVSFKSKVGNVQRVLLADGNI